MITPFSSENILSSIQRKELLHQVDYFRRSGKPGRDDPL